jgi:genome maintenance exonuclease 1
MFPSIEYDRSKIHDLEQIKTEKGRFYVGPFGERYPSVTTVLSWKSAPAIAKWRKRVGHEAATKIVTQAARRGTGMHTVCERYLLNEENYLRDTMPNVQMLFQPVKAALDNHVTGIYCLEQRLYSDYIGVAGTVDFIGQYKGKPAVIDFKTSIKIKKLEYMQNYFMQASAYCVMFEELTGIAVPRIVIMMASDEGDFCIFEQKRDDHIFKFIDLVNDYKATMAS